MRRSGCIVIMAAIVVAIGSPIAHTGEPSGFGFKMSFGVGGFPSDKNISAVIYPITGDDPSIFDARGVMLYHYDRKFARTLYGALCYQATNNLEFEMGFGYTDLQLEITQHSEIPLGDPDADDETRWDLDTRKDGDFSIMAIRSGAKFSLAGTSRIIPYICAGVNVMRVKGKATLDYVSPNVTARGPYYDLNTPVAQMNIEGRDTVFGLDLGSGLEYRITPGVSATFGAAYLFQFEKALIDFDEMVKDPGDDPNLENTTYYSDGMSMSNISFSLGVSVRL